MRKVVFLLVPTLILVFITTLFFKVIKINKVICINQNGICSEKLRQDISSIELSNIFDTRKKIEEVLIKNKNVSDYSIQFSLPLNYEVNVIEETGKVAFVKPDGVFAIVNGRGEIIDNLSETTLPKVISYSNLTTNQLMYIANLLNRIYNFFGSTSAKVSLDGLEVGNIKGKTVIFPIEGDQDVLLGSLNLILSRLPSIKNATTISVIDLRFKNPVLR